MSTKHCKKIKKSRLRLKTALPHHLTLFFAFGIISSHVLHINASVDYSKTIQPISNSDENTADFSSSDDELYESLLRQQDMDDSTVHRNYTLNDQFTDIRKHTEKPIMDIGNHHHRKLSDNNISSEYSSLEYEQLPVQNNVQQANHLPNSSEEYYDDERLNITSESDSNKHSIPSITTMLPILVRKPKSEHTTTTMSINSAEMYIDENASYSDYTDEKLSTGNKAKLNDTIDPVAMKLYQDAPELEKEFQQNSHIVSLPQHQQVSDQPRTQEFYHPAFTVANNRDIYDENYNIQSTPPNTLITDAPALAIARAGIPSFSFPFKGIWNNAPSTEIITTTLPPITNNAGMVPLLQTIYTTTFTPSTTRPHQYTSLQDNTTPLSISADSELQPLGNMPNPLATIMPPQLPYPTTFSPITTPQPLPQTQSQPQSTPATTTILPTTGRPAGNKQGKQINISRRKLLPHEQLRNYIEDAYIRMPLAVIIDPSSESLEKTKALWRDALHTNINIKIVLVSLNASGLPAAYNFNNTRQFLAGLNSLKEHNGGDAFIGIVHASELVPYDSAVFVSTASIPPHTELVQDAAITLLKKRIRLYLIWYGERSLSENETQDAVGGILGEVAIRSGGEILHIVGSENSQELEGNPLTLIADAFRGAQEVDVPVDTTLSSLHVKIDASMRVATLETPNGDINLKKLIKFKSRVFSFGPDDQRLDTFVPLTKLRKSTVFKLKLIPEFPNDEYHVIVRADRKADIFLDDMIKRFDTLFMEGGSVYPTRFRNSRLQSITAALVAATIPTHDTLKFPDDTQNFPKKDSVNAPKTEVETLSETEIHQIATQNTTAKDSMAKELKNERSPDVLQRGITKIEIGINSQILVAPGMMGQLQFELTNTRTEPIFHNIQVVDERRYLLRLSPQGILLRPGEMSIVTVTVLVPTGTPQGTIDRITFTCNGGGTASLSMNLKVITTTDAQDSTSPSISWTFGSRCEHIAVTDTARCAERFWTLDINAQDWETGIMRLQSTPSNGLFYRNNYIVGSTEPLKATYISTCCEPKVSLIAYDIAGNQRSYNIDVRDIVFTEAAIAAIVLGVVLIIVLVAAIIASIVWCCRRRKIVLDLPTYRSHSTRSME